MDNFEGLESLDAVSICLVIEKVHANTVTVTVLQQIAIQGQKYS